MYGKIKEMAEEALKLQNKNFMDETFKRIIAACESALAMEAFANAELRRQQADAEPLVISENFEPTRISAYALDDDSLPNCEAIPGTTQPKPFYVDDATVTVTDTAIHVDTTPAEFPFSPAPSISAIDAMLGEIPPGPQVVLKPAEVAYSVDASGKPELPPAPPDSKKKAKTGGAK